MLIFSKTYFDDFSWTWCDTAKRFVDLISASETDLERRILSSEIKILLFIVTKAEFLIVFVCVASKKKQRRQINIFSWIRIDKLLTNVHCSLNVLLCFVNSMKKDASTLLSGFVGSMDDRKTGVQVKSRIMILRTALRKLFSNMAKIMFLSGIHFYLNLKMTLERSLPLDYLIFKTYKRHKIKQKTRLRM